VLATIGQARFTSSDAVRLGLRYRGDVVSPFTVQTNANPDSVASGSHPKGRIQGFGTLSATVAVPCALIDGALL
jgi:hypothetical protein